MIELIYSGNTYNLPTKFNEITLDKYMEIIKMDKKLTEIERLIEILSILTGLSHDDVKNINMDQVKAISNHIQFLFKSETKLLTEQIKINGNWYGFNKNLYDVSFGEYIDLEEFSKEENIGKNLHILMAILYRPLKQKKKASTFNNLIKNYIYTKDKFVKDYEIEDYNQEKIKDRAEMFKKYMTLDIVLGAMFFFTILKRVYISNIKQSLTKKEMMKETILYMKAAGVDFKPIGDG